MPELAFTEVDTEGFDDIESIGRHLGPSETTDTDQATGFTAQVHDAPILMSVKSMVGQTGGSADNPLYQRYDLWMVPHRFSIFRKDGGGKVDSIGCEIEYLGTRSAHSIVSIFPSAEYVTTSPLAVEAKSKAFALLDQTGISALLGMKAVDLLQSSVKVDLPGVDLDVEIADTSKLRLALELPTPIVLATGVGSKRCTFQFNRHDKPLEGRDLETWAVVAAHKRSREISYRMKLFYTIRKFMIPRRWETAWVEIAGKCEEAKVADAI